MKTEAKCYKCGKKIFVHDYAPTDICPECMSFIETERAIRALEEEESAPEAEKSAACEFSKEAAAAIGKAVCEDAAPFETQMQEKAFAPPRAEEEAFGKIFETFAAPPERKADVLKPRLRNEWEKVLKGTDDLSDFSRFDSVRVCAEHVVSEMSEREGYELFLAHYERLEETRKKLRDRLDAASFGNGGEKSKTKAMLLSIWGCVALAAFFIVRFAVEDFSRDFYGFIVIFVGLFAIFALTAIAKISSAKQKKNERANNAVNPFTEDYGEELFAGGKTPRQEYEKLEEQIDDIDWLFNALEKAYESVNGETEA